MADTDKDIEKVSDDNAVEASRLSKQNSLLNDRQSELLWRATPDAHIQTRKGRGGQQFSYVTIQYVEMYLNAMTGHDWDFEVKEWKIIDDQILVLGSLTLRFGHKKGDRAEVTKEQFGSSEVKYMKQTDQEKAADKPKVMVDLADDLKAAASDALKKCASLFGVAWDVYGKDEFKPINVKRTKIKGSVNTPSEVRARIEAARTVTTDHQPTAVEVQSANE